MIERFASDAVLDTLIMRKKCRVLKINFQKFVKISISLRELQIHHSGFWGCSQGFGLLETL